MYKRQEYGCVGAGRRDLPGPGMEPGFQTAYFSGCFCGCLLYTSLTNKMILVTGAAGFIGSNLVMELLKEVHPVHIIGIDNMNDYYDVSIRNTV